MPQNKTILILGGTIEARQLAAILARQGRAVITSLAGVTKFPKLPQGRWRSGGFGGVDGLVQFAGSADIGVIVDATHPFAQGISDNAAKAASKLAVPLIRLSRAPWEESTDFPWQKAKDLKDAAKKIPRNARVFLTTGRQNLAPMLHRKDLTVIMRSIEAVDVPDHWTAITQRPPFSYEHELALLRSNQIEVLITKNAGGAQVDAKLKAARALDIKVIMIDRPPHPVGLTKLVVTVDEALEALNSV